MKVQLVGLPKLQKHWFSKNKNKTSKALHHYKIIKIMFLLDKMGFCPFQAN